MAGAPRSVAPLRHDDPRCQRRSALFLGVVFCLGRKRSNLHQQTLKTAFRRRDGGDLALWCQSQRRGSVRVLEPLWDWHQSAKSQGVWGTDPPGNRQMTSSLQLAKLGLHGLRFTLNQYSTTSRRLWSAPSSPSAMTLWRRTGRGRFGFSRWRVLGCSRSVSFGRFHVLPYFQHSMELRPLTCLTTGLIRCVEAGLTEAKNGNEVCPSHGTAPNVLFSFPLFVYV